MTLRELRGHYGLSLEDIAQMTGVALSAVECMDAGRPVKPERGDERPSQAHPCAEYAAAQYNSPHCRQ